MAAEINANFEPTKSKRVFNNGELAEHNSVSVEFYGRKPYAGQYSIEASFVRIGDALKKLGVSVSKRTASHHSRGLLSRLLIMLDVRRGRKAEILHVTGDIHFAVLFASRPVVLTIHDLQMLSRLSGFRRAFLKLFWFTLPCLRADKICVISNATKTRLLEEVPGIEDKVTIVPSIVSETLVPVQRPFNEGRPRILAIGTKKNKNLPRLIAAISELSATLVVLGRIDRDLSELIVEHDVEVEVHIGIEESELVELYASADLLAMVSTEEGFGMPIVEAQRMDVPVVTSNISSMPEVAGEGAVLVDPTSVESIRAGITRVIQDADLRERTKLWGRKNAERFSAEAVAQTLNALYDDLRSSQR